MPRKPPRPPDDPGITRLPRRRKFSTSDPKDMADLVAALHEFTEAWNASKAWTFAGRVAPLEELARRLAPDYAEPAEMLHAHRAGRLKPRSLPAEGTAAWIAEKILNRLRLARKLSGDAALIAALEAGMWYGHLATKLDWEREALAGERSIAAGRHGRRGGRAPLVDVPAPLVDVLQARGSARRRLAEAVAQKAGVRPESVLRAARRHRGRLT